VKCLHVGEPNNSQLLWSRSGVAVCSKEYSVMGMWRMWTGG
jgi:hypothetical protein